MKHIIRTIGLKNIEAIQARAEDKEIMKKFDSSFDVVTSRAFSELGKFLDIAAPYAKKEGMLLAVKGPRGIDELKGLKDFKGIKSVKVKEVRLPFSDITTTLLAFKKM